MVTLRKAYWTVMTGCVLVTLYLSCYMYFAISALTATRATPLERWLFVADPQIQGDERVAKDGLYGQLDVLYNDWYLTHVMDNAYRFLRPHLVFVVGDLISNHQAGAFEFQDRVERLRAIFEREGRVSPDFLSGAFADPSQEPPRSSVQADFPQHLHGDGGPPQAPLVWLVGNHDIGYGGEIMESRLDAWELAFGPSNRLLRSPSGHWFAVLNSQTLDATRKPAHRERTLEFVASVPAAVAPGEPLVLVKHIPLHKEAGFCSDAPLLKLSAGGAVLKQNFLSPAASELLLEQLAPVMIFNGHDHEGCSYAHAWPPGHRTPEYTLRSVMGDYSGYVTVVDVHRHTPQPGDQEQDQQDQQAGRAFVYHVSHIPFVSIRVVTALILLWVLLLLIGAFVLVRSPRLGAAAFLEYERVAGKTE